MPEYLGLCPLSGGEKTKIVFVVPSITLEFESKIRKCLDCGLLYVNPGLAEDEVKVWYGKQYASFDDLKSKVDFGYAERERRIDRLKGIMRYRTSGKLLDIDCRTGFFLHIVRENSDFDVTGTGLDPMAVEYAEKEFGLIIML